MIDPKQHSTVVQSVEPVNDDTAEIEGTEADWSGYNTAIAVVEAGVLGAAATFSAFLEESDLSDFSAGVVVLDSLEDVAIAGDQASYLLGAPRKASSKKYIRGRVTKGGTGNALVGVTLVLQKPVDAPVS